VTYVFARCNFSGVALALSSPLVSILLISSVNLVVSLAPYVRRSDTEPRYIRTILVRHSISHRSKSPKSLVIFQRGLEAPRNTCDDKPRASGILRTNRRISGLPANESPSSGFRRLIKSARKGGALFLTASAARVVINTFPSRISLRHSSNISENISLRGCNR